MKLLVVCLFVIVCLLNCLADESTTNKPSFWKMCATAVTPIPTNSYYKPFETDITEYGIYGTGKHFGGGLRGQYWTSMGIGAGLDMSFYNNQISYTSLSLQGHTVVGPISIGIEAGTGVNLSNPNDKGMQAQTGICFTYQTTNHKIFGIDFNPRFFSEIQTMSSQTDTRFLFGLQQSF